MACNALSTLRAQGTHRVIASPRLDLSLSGQDLFGHLCADALTQHFPGAFCGRRGEVEIKLVLLCRWYPSEGAWNWAPQIISHY